VLLCNVVTRMHPRFVCRSPCSSTALRTTNSTARCAARRVPTAASGHAKVFFPKIWCGGRDRLVRAAASSAEIWNRCDGRESWREREGRGTRSHACTGMTGGCGNSSYVWDCALGTFPSHDEGVGRRREVAVRDGGVLRWICWKRRRACEGVLT
jgi:hypothetical protein